MIDLKEKAKTTLDEIDIAAVETGKYSDMVDMLEIALRAVRKDALDAGKWEAIHALAGVSGLYTHRGDWVDIDYKTRDVCVAVIRNLIEGEQK